MDNSQNNEQVIELKNRFNQFIETLEAIEPEHTDLQDIDRLIMLLDELEDQMDSSKK
ncbi:SE1561 family protein [Sporosarcina ureae]|uniref:SE1561 family protein n=1 Tax=Sporosarcina ureae TaxID=1571 RepID=UPI0014301D80|nr:SE1561 family protein [Sporosarcina ureae]